MKSDLWLGSRRSLRGTPELHFTSTLRYLLVVIVRCVPVAAMRSLTSNSGPETQ